MSTYNRLHLETLESTDYAQKSPQTLVLESVLRQGVA